MTEECDIVFRKATSNDVDSIMEIVADAQRSLGDRGIDQWQDGYPQRDRIKDDIRDGIGWICELQGDIAGYAAIVINGEPEYENLEGEWLSTGNYVVVHRICVRKKFVRHGVASALLRHAAKEAILQDVHSFKIDTHEKNQYMLNLLEKFGFTYCGIVSYEHGKRVAFEKLL